MTQPELPAAEAAPGRKSPLPNAWQRVVTAVFLLPVIAIVYWAPSWLCLALFSLGAVLSFQELCGVLRVIDQVPLRVTGSLLTLALVASFSLEVWGAGLVLALALAVLPGAWVCRRLPLERAFVSLAGNLLGVVIAGVFMGFQMALRMKQVPGGGSVGGALLLFLYVTVFTGDIAALYTGRLIGRHRMAPRISPKKTWEGLGGNLAGNLLGAWVCSPLLPPELQGWQMPVLALLLGLAGVCGDLTISLLKRSAGVKDTGTLLPGHGGVLDRLDSLLLSGPVLFYYCKYVAGF